MKKLSKETLDFLNEQTILCAGIEEKIGQFIKNYLTENEHLKIAHPTILAAFGYMFSKINDSSSEVEKKIAMIIHDKLRSSF